jgi:hypothetical protein
MNAQTRNKKIAFVEQLQRKKRWRKKILKSNGTNFKTFAP